MAGPGTVRGRRSALRVLAACVLPGGRAGAAPPAIPLRVVVDPGDQRYAAALRALRARYVNITIDVDPRRESRAPRQALCITLGAEALGATLSARLDAPVISLLASRQTYERALALHPADGLRSGIYAEPDPRSQFRLIASIYKRSVTVGTLLSPSTSHLEPGLRDAASANRLRLEAVRVDTGASLSRSLNRFDAATAVLIQPDSDLYTPASLRELLESTYRRRMPVIGFSPTLVSAGTLASAYSSVEDTLAQLDGLIDSLAARRPVAPRYPVFWRVAINENVARSLDIVIDDAIRSMGDRP